MSIKVKALEWTQYPDGGLQAIGAKMERFRVHPNGRSWYLGQDYMGEGGKDAAQAWFNATILSVLEPSSDMREVVSLLEAASVALWRAGKNSMAREIDEYLDRVSPDSNAAIAAKLSEAKP